MKLSFLNEFPKKDIYAVFTFFSIHSAFFHMVIVSYVRFVMITDPLQSLKLTCSSILFKSCAVWISSVVISLVYGQAHWFTMETMHWIKIGFVLYVCGVPFIAVMYLNLRKLYYLYNQTSSVRRIRIANSMSLMFCIIIVLYLLSTMYPLFYAIDNAVLRNRSLLNRRVKIVHKLFNFSLFGNSCLNPLIYFMFSPPVLRLLSRLRKCCQSTDARINNPSSCPTIELSSWLIFPFSLTRKWALASKWSGYNFKQ